MECARAMGVPNEARERARDALLHALGLVRADPPRHGTLDILVLDRLRRQALVEMGVDDVFRDVKQRENEAALALLPGHLAAIDDASKGARLELIVRGMLAGNFFDLGAEATASRYAAGALAFAEARASVPRRPWRFDELDRANDFLASRPPRRAVLFADNAGPDAVLGLLPLARHLAAGGTSVVLAANARPSLNDVTHGELRTLVTRAAEADAALAGAAIEVVSSGCAAPLIDLADVSPELAAASADADLVVLIGMGRAVESNWSARFTCACLRVAMVKDPQVARGIGAELFDAVVRFDEVP